MNRTLLAIYLNDHLAGSTGALELLRRAGKAERYTEFGPFFDRLRQEVDRDREPVEELMDSLGIAQSRVKRAGAWALEKAGRLKLNGSVVSRSPLSRLLELEALSTGVSGKLGLWQALSEFPDDPALSGLDLPTLIGRAEAQLAELEEYRSRAARLAFA